MKKEATIKNTKGIIQNTFDRKKANPKNANGLIQKDFQ
jgi:hypothetical protein